MTSEVGLKLRRSSSTTRYEVSFLYGERFESAWSAVGLNDWLFRGIDCQMQPTCSVREKCDEWTVSLRGKTKHSSFKLLIEHQKGFRARNVKKTSSGRGQGQGHMVDATAKAEAKFCNNSNDKSYN